MLTSIRCEQFTLQLITEGKLQFAARCTRCENEQCMRTIYTCISECMQNATRSFETRQPQGAACGEHVAGVSGAHRHSGRQNYLAGHARMPLLYVAWEMKEPN